MLILQDVHPQGGVTTEGWGKFDAKCVNISKTLVYTSKVTIGD